MRPRRRKAPKQVDDRRDRFQGKRRQGGSRRQRFRQSRVRVRSNSVLHHRYQDMVQFYSDEDSSCDRHSVYDYPYNRAHRSRETMVIREGFQHGSDGVQQDFQYQVDDFPRLAANDGTGFEQKRKVYKSVSRRRTQVPLVQHDISGKVLPESVSFYFTNVPLDISYISLRQGFEVCGIMEDVYLARKRNVNGGAFGFVRYSKVKDVEKLLKALNNVWFGDWRVVAKVASFDKFGRSQVVGGKREGVKNSDGVRNSMVVRDEEVVGVMGREDETLGDGSKKVTNGVVQSKQRYVPVYRSDIQDELWASKGLVVTVMNGEAIPVLQHRIYDAGFESLDLTSLGADKVLLRSSGEGEVSNILSEVAEFFGNFFSMSLRWNKDILVRERGAWVRIYGVPLHAWNLNFFQTMCIGLWSIVAGG